MTSENSSHDMHILTRRYGADSEALTAVLCPMLIPIYSLNKTVFVAEGQRHVRATFQLEITEENKVVLARGRTGKFVPAGYGGGEPGWRELAKGRIISVDYYSRLARGEVYLGFGGASITDLESALVNLSENDFLEIDQYGASAKVLSGLSEYYLAQNLVASGYEIFRMPEDMAAHLGAYANFDFTLRKAGVEKRLEVKSLWGTDTRYARLIHSRTTPPRGDSSSWTDAQRMNYYPTSSCKFVTQDFFAVSLFLRTGSVRDFAFARSVPRSIERPYGLPVSRGYPEHVGQNPLCEIGDGTWYNNINDVWGLL